MQLTKYTELSLRVMMYLAINQHKLSTIQEVSEIYHISKNHLVKVVNQLAVLGYIESIQGRGGGIRLAVDAEEIGVGDVVRAMESTLDIVNCDNGSCPLLPACLLKSALNEAVQAFLKSLDQYTVQDLIRNKPQLLKLIS